MKNRIKVYRAMHDLTQEKLADELGVTRQTILAIEKGKYYPSLDLAFRIARYFGVTIEDVFIDEAVDSGKTVNKIPSCFHPPNPPAGSRNNYQSFPIAIRIEKSEKRWIISSRSPARTSWGRYTRPPRRQTSVPQNPDCPPI